VQQFQNSDSNHINRRLSRERRFQYTKRWVQEMKFDRMGCFAYSHEENTHAYLLEDDVPDSVKQDRC
jgi:ribosomal protein S12 methylthiotransferase